MKTKEKRIDFFSSNFPRFYLQVIIQRNVARVTIDYFINRAGSADNTCCQWRIYSFKCNGNWFSSDAEQVGSNVCWKSRIKRPNPSFASHVWRKVKLNKSASMNDVESVVSFTDQISTICIDDSVNVENETNVTSVQRLTSTHIDKPEDIQRICTTKIELNERSIEDFASF